MGAITADKGIDLSADAAKDMELSNLKGSLSLTYVYLLEKPTIF